MSTQLPSRIIEKRAALAAVAAHTALVSVLAAFGNEWAPLGVVAADVPFSLILVPLAKLAFRVNAVDAVQQTLFWAVFLVFGAMWQYVIWKYLGRLGYWLYHR